MNNFVPMRITIYLESGYCKLSNMPFDSILAKLYFQKEINNGTFDGNYYKQLPFLKMTDGIYHTSKPVYFTKYISNEVLLKRFDYRTFIHLNGDISAQKTLSNNQSGRYKNYLLNFELEHLDNIIYYINGEKDEITKLLQSFNFIGKKASLGWGKIFKIDIEELQNDYSLFNENNIPMRHFPNITKYKSHNMSEVLLPLTPPYWEHTNSISLVYSGNEEC